MWRRKKLFSKRELRRLNGFWWLSLSHIPDALNSGRLSVTDQIAVSKIQDEFAEALEWLETL